MAIYHLRKGWVSLRDPAAFYPPPLDLDARFKEAAFVLRLRWETHNAERGIEYDYDDYGTLYESDTEEEAWSEEDAEDPEVFDDWI
jgi:hypothetical protein